MSATSTRPNKATAAKTKTLSVDAIIKKMDALLPKWKLYVRDDESRGWGLPLHSRPQDGNVRGDD